MSLVVFIVLFTRLLCTPIRDNSDEEIRGHSIGNNYFRMI